jgi:Uma2 family endonuclease
MNVAAKLDGSAANADCRVSVNDVRLQVAHDIFYYPDVMVACGPEPEDPYIEDAPCLVVEVVSKSTESIDRREKTTFYRRIPGLRAYWIVEQENRRIGRHWREAGGEWQYDEIVGEGIIPCRCLETEIRLDEVYARTG